MLSLSGGMSAAHASHYFGADDYYLKGGEPSRWLGKGAATLKLEGKVEQGHFRNVIEGRSPDGAEQLVALKVTRGEDGARIESHRAGNDLTFSAPKSLSIGYVAGVHELKGIWDQAVENTMAIVEEHYSQYRTPQGIETAGNVVAAKFDHLTSRGLDPEVHSHVFVANMVQGRGGWQANELKNVYYDKIFLGMMCRAEAIRLLHQAGFQVEITDRDLLLFEIKGVSRELIELFSKQRSAIVEKVAQWRKEGAFPGVSDAVLKAMAALDVRDPKIKITLAELGKVWEGDFVAAGTSTKEVRQQVLGEKSLAGRPFRYLAPADYPVTMATVVSSTNLVALKHHPEYNAAKEEGDIHAARDVVDDLVKPAAIEEIQKMIPPGREIYVIPVGQREKGGLNMLPLAYAERLAEDLGGRVWTDIFKVAGATNTGKHLDERLKNIQVFRGPIPPKDSIIILADDVFTVGGTVAALTDHLAQSGQTPHCVTTLAPAQYGKRLKPTEREIDGLLRKAGVSAEQFDSEFGYHPRFLTGGEIRSYLVYGARGIAGARARFYEGRSGKGPEHPQTQTTQKSPDDILRNAASFLTDREVIFDRAAVLKTALQISGGEHSPFQLSAALSPRNGFFLVGQVRQGPQAGREFWTTEEMLRLEARNLADLRALTPFASVTSREEVETYLKGLAGEPLSPEAIPHRAAFEAGAESAALLGPVHLSSGQRAYVVNELTGGGAYGVVQGDPGAGKTFASGVVERFNTEVLLPSGREHRAINIAYTGKAALEMEKASGQEAHTIHAFLGRWGQSANPAASFGIRNDRKAQTVLRIDEASFVGGRQAQELIRVIRELKAQGAQIKPVLVGDSKQMQSIQASPFFIHASELARDGEGSWTVLKEITRQKDQGLLEVARVLNRDVPKLGSNAADALQMLQQQGRVSEIAERGRLVQATVAHYLSEVAKPSPDPARRAAGEQQSVLVVTPLHADRRDLNERIRQARLERGELPGGRNIQILTQVEQGVTAAPYRPGMVLVLTPGKEGVPAQCPNGIKRMKGEGTVVAASLEENTVTVSFPVTKGREEVATFPASQLPLRSALFRKEEKAFAVGEQIVFGKNTRRGIFPAEGGKNIGVRNSERGTIEELSAAGGSTTALVRLTGGRRIRVELERFGPQQIDYGYVITTPKGQGETVDHVLSFNYVKPATANEKNLLAKIAGRDVSAQEFARWNSGLTDEAQYRAGTAVGGHVGTVSFVMIADPAQSATEQKGIAVHFADSAAVVKNEALRLKMREAGMYWSPEMGAWVAAATNQEVLRLIEHHPLKDQTYLSRLGEPPVSSPGPTERNYRAELDTFRSAEHFGRVSFNAFNVAVTRASHDAHIFTNSVAGFRRAVQMVDQKTSTVGHPLLAGRESALRKVLHRTSTLAPTTAAPLSPSPPSPAPPTPVSKSKGVNRELELKPKR